MEKEIKITIPEGYEIDKENSTFECIKFKPKKLTYEDVAKELFDNKEVYYADSIGNIDHYKCYIVTNIPNVCTSEHQVKRLIAINKLLNVAEYLNKGWKPDWDSTIEYKYIFTANNWKIKIDYINQFQGFLVYFKTQELAEQALEILGEETIKLAIL